MDDNYERWEPCKNFEDYEISTEGRVRNVGTDRVLKTNVNKKGYEQVSLNKNGKTVNRTIHRLMGDTYLEKDETHRHNVKHKDGDKLNNDLYNLRLCYGEVSQGKKRRVRCIETGEIFDSLTECARAFGIGIKTISQYINTDREYELQCGLHFEPVD